MRGFLVALLVLSTPVFAWDDGTARFRPNDRRVLRVGSQYLGRGFSRYDRHQDFGSRRDQSWRLSRVRRPWANQDPYSYGRCYWRGYYRPYLYCRQYTPRYSYYSTTPNRYPQPRGLPGPSYPTAYALPPQVYGPWAGPAPYPGYRADYGYGYSFSGYGGYGDVYQSRYGYRYPHAYLYGGAGPYGFADPWGYRLLPAFDFAPILTRLTTVFTIDGAEFDGEAGADNADGLPMPRSKPVGSRFLTPEE